MSEVKLRYFIEWGGEAKAQKVEAAKGRESQSKQISYTREAGGGREEEEEGKGRRKRSG